MTHNISADAELLYFGHGSRTDVQLHSHAYYQLEYCISGCLQVFNGKKQFTLNAGDFWLIRPGEMHCFHSKGPLEYISIKFNSKRNFESVANREPVCVFYLNEIRKFIDGESVFSIYSAEGKEIVENYLSGFLTGLQNVSSRNHTSEFENKLQRIIFQNGALTTVDDLAEHFHLTRAEFKYLFLKETGSGKIKKYVDHILLKMSEQHLRYSDMPVCKIAEELHFSSIYAFSRYYKYYQGISPAAFRKSVKKDFE